MPLCAEKGVLVFQLVSCPPQLPGINYFQLLGTRAAFSFGAASAVFNEKNKRNDRLWVHAHNAKTGITWRDLSLCLS